MSQLSEPTANSNLWHGDGLITISIGPPSEALRFCTMLSDVTPRIADAIQGLLFSEGKLVLGEASEEKYRDLWNWIATKGLRYPDQNGNIPNSAALNWTKAVDLYIIATTYDTPDLRASVIDAIHAEFLRPDLVLPKPKDVKLAFDALPADCPLCEVFVDAFVRIWNGEWRHALDQADSNELSPKFMYRFLLRSIELGAATELMTAAEDEVMMEIGG